MKKNTFYRYFATFNLCVSYYEGLCVLMIPESCA